MVGIGAAASTTFGGVLIQHFGYRVSFLGLAAIALLACTLLWLTVPETLSNIAAATSTSTSDTNSTTKREGQVEHPPSSIM
jgi:predicted MFS family arabinose efflux permease